MISYFRITDNTFNITGMCFSFPGRINWQLGLGRKEGKRSTSIWAKPRISAEKSIVLFEDLNHAPPQFKKKRPISRNVKRCRFCSSTRIRFPYWITLNFISVPFFQFSYFCQFAPFPLNLFQSWPDRIKICPWFLDWSYISPWFFDYSFLSLTPNFNFLFSVKLLIDLLN